MVEYGALSKPNGKADRKFFSRLPFPYKHIPTHIPNRIDCKWTRTSLKMLASQNKMWEKQSRACNSSLEKCLRHSLIKPVIKSFTNKSSRVFAIFLRFLQKLLHFLHFQHNLFQFFQCLHDWNWSMMFHIALLNQIELQRDLDYYKMCIFSSSSKLSVPLFHFWRGVWASHEKIVCV